MDAEGLESGTMFCGFCRECDCKSLKITEVGWKYIKLNDSCGYPGWGLGYVWTAEAGTDGSRSCSINTVVSGSIKMTTDNPGDSKTFTPSILGSYFSDGGCHLPGWGAVNDNGCNCRGTFNKCAGSMCYLDAPGIPASYIDNFIRKKRKKLCVELDVEFDVWCHGENEGEHDLPPIHQKLKITSSKCVRLPGIALDVGVARNSDYCGIGKK